MGQWDLLIDKCENESFQLEFFIHLKEKNLWLEGYKVNTSKRELQPEKSLEAVRQSLGSLSKFESPER